MFAETPSSPENLVLLLSQHQESIFRYIYCLVPVEADARDIQQETSLALYRKWEQFDTSRPFLPWAFRFAYLQVQKHREKSARSPLTFAPDVLDLLASEREGFTFQRSAEGRALAADDAYLWANAMFERRQRA